MGGTEQVELTVSIQNAGETGVFDVPVRLICPEINYSYQGTISVDPLSLTMWTVPFFSAVGAKTFQTVINPDSTTIESRYDNNAMEKIIDIQYFNVTPERGTTFGTNSADTVGIPEKCFCIIPWKDVRVS